MDRAGLSGAEPVTWRLAIGLLLVGAAAYALLPLEPLYFDNQNTKFLFGLAKADVGRLADDWMIDQGSELPIFDALVYFTYALVGKVGFYIWHFAAFIAYTVGVYGFARIVGLTSTDHLGRDGRWFLPIFGASWIALNSNHAALKAFQGVGHQYLTGFAFEPQAFGVLALLGLLLFRLGQAGWAVVLIIAAAWLHPAYSITGLMLLLGMLVARWRCGATVNLPPLTLAGGIFGCLAAAGFAYSLLQPSDAVTQAEATRIIVEVRIPHHSLPRAWLDDGDPQIKLLGIAFVVWLIWRDPIAWVLAVAAACIVALTLWVHFAGDAELALAAPWRASTIIVPVANAILLGRLIQTVAKWAAGDALKRTIALSAFAALLAVAVGFGQWERIADLRSRQPQPAYFAWVRENARDGDLFLTPVRQLDFRLATGQPQYVSWKTHPYRGESVLEWYARLGKAEAVTLSTPPSCQLLTGLAHEGVTHLVRQTAQTGLSCPGWRSVYQDGAVTIFSSRV